MTAETPETDQGGGGFQLSKLPAAWALGLALVSGGGVGAVIQTVLQAAVDSGHAATQLPVINGQLIAVQAHIAAHEAAEGHPVMSNRVEGLADDIEQIEGEREALDKRLRSIESSQIRSDSNQLLICAKLGVPCSGL